MRVSIFYAAELQDWAFTSEHIFFYFSLFQTSALFSRAA